MTINYISLCSGYGAECLALKRLRHDHPGEFGFNLLAWAEIEPYACAAHDALHADADRNLGDITAVDWKQWHESIGNPHVDLLFASTPCQSVSTAGKQEGMKKGTDAASALIWATEQCIATLLPDFIIYENVKGLISKRNMPDFMEFCATIEKYGYRHMYKVLNAKDFGVPQNRERVFPIFYRDPDWQFEYPKPFPLEKRLRDVLEEYVDESYYLKDEQVRRILAHCDRKQAEGCNFHANFLSAHEVSTAITAQYGSCETDTYLRTDEVVPINTVSDGCAKTLLAHYHKAGGDDFNPSNGGVKHTAVLEITEEPKILQVGNYKGDGNTNPQTGRVYSPDGIAPTLIANSQGGDREPKIMQIGSYSPSSACNAKVLDTDGICPTLLDHKGAEPAILTPIRTEEQRQLRKQGIDTFGGRQMLPRTDGVSNTITTVQKDNLLQEPIKIRQATAQGYIECPVGGGFDAAYPNSKLRRGRVQDNGDVVGAITASGDEHCVYEGAEVIGPMQSNAMRGNVDGVSPCLTETMGMGGGQIPMIVQMPHGYNSGGLRNGEVSPAITTSSWESNNMLVEPCGCYDNQFGEFAREPLEGLSRTVKTDGHNAVLLSRKDDVVFKEMPDGNIHAYRANDPKKSTAPEWQITNADNVHPTITTSHEPKVLLKYRIRKLTPTECFRLMGMDDADIEKIDAYRIKTVLKSGKVKEKPIPKSAKHKLAGNSIVVDVLYHLFRNMFLPSCNTNPKRHEPSLADFW